MPMNDNYANAGATSHTYTHNTRSTLTLAWAHKHPVRCDATVHQQLQRMPTCSFPACVPISLHVRAVLLARECGCQYCSKRLHAKCGNQQMCKRMLIGKNDSRRGGAKGVTHRKKRCNSTKQHHGRPVVTKACHQPPIYATHTCLCVPRVQDSSCVQLFRYANRVSPHHAV